MKRSAKPLDRIFSYKVGKAISKRVKYVDSLGEIAALRDTRLLFETITKLWSLGPTGYLKYKAEPCVSADSFGEAV